MDATVSWTLPPVSTRQRPLKHVRIEFRVQATPALPWTVQDNVSAQLPEQKLVFVDIAPGMYEFRATVFDIDDTMSKNPPVVEGRVPSDPPGDVTNLTFVVA